MGYLHHVVSYFDIEHQNFGNLVDLMDIRHTRQLTQQSQASCMWRNEKHPVISTIELHKTWMTKASLVLFHKSSQVISVNNPEDKGDKEIVFIYLFFLVCFGL